MENDLKEPSTLAHILTFIAVFSSIVVAFVMVVQFFKADGSLERTWDALATWFDNALDD